MQFEDIVSKYRTNDLSIFFVNFVEDIFTLFGSLLCNFGADFNQLQLHAIHFAMISIKIQRAEYPQQFVGGVYVVGELDPGDHPFRHRNRSLHVVEISIKMWASNTR